MNILFVSRAYPPVVGGIENQNYALSQWLPQSSQVHTVANTRGKKFLPLFLPYAVIYCLIAFRKYDCLLLGDGVLAVVGFVAKLRYPKKKVICNIHGLDLTYKNALYQTLWVRLFLPLLDGYIAVSKETRAIAIRAGLKDEKIKIIPNGVEEPKESGFTRQDLESTLDQSLAERIVLLTAGRLAKRKGVYWFIENVLPSLPESVIYAVAGAGPERKRIETLLEAHPDWRKKVIFLGRVSDHQKEILLQTADIFVQPNIPVENDIEGFGIAVLEASLRGRPVVASDLEGLRDAVTEGENGLFAPSQDAQRWQQILLRLIELPHERLSLGDRARTFTRTHYLWSKVATMYTDYISALVYADH